MDKLEFIANMVTIISMTLAIVFSMIAIIKQNSRQAILDEVYELLQSIYEGQNSFDNDDFIEAENAVNHYCLIRISEIASIERKPSYERNKYKYQVTLTNGERFTTDFIPERCADLINHYNH